MDSRLPHGPRAVGGVLWAAPLPQISWQAVKRLAARLPVAAQWNWTRCGRRPDVPNRQGIRGGRNRASRLGPSPGRGPHAAGAAAASARRLPRWPPRLPRCVQPTSLLALSCARPSHPGNISRGAQQPRRHTRRLVATQRGGRPNLPQPPASSMARLVLLLALCATLWWPGAEARGESRRAGGAAHTGSSCRHVRAAAAPSAHPTCVHLHLPRRPSL